jgi:hypothetical protein
MAVVKRERADEEPRERKKFKAPKSEPVDFVLPEDKTEPISDLGGAVILITGEKKIGKTSLANQFGKNLVLAFEVGYKGLRIFKSDVPNWDTARAALKVLRKDKHYTTVTVDTADKSFTQCDAWVCRRLGITHPSEEDWGKGWAAIRKEYTDWIDGLTYTSKGVILISHSQEREVKKRGGESYDRIMPTMPKQAREIVEGLVDIWCHYQYDGDRRILTILGDDHISAGHRFTERFRTPDGVPIRNIDMGRSPEEAYRNFKAAWHNKYEPEFDEDLAQDTRPKKKTKFKLKA